MRTKKPRERLTGNGDRRVGYRFDIELPLQLYNVKGACVGTGRSSSSATGKSLNISSTGILFTVVDQKLIIAGDWFIKLAWPIKLNDKVPLNLVLSARVVRIDGPTVAAAFDEYEFHTAGA